MGLLGKQCFMVTKECFYTDFIKILTPCSYLTVTVLLYYIWLLTSPCIVLIDEVMKLQPAQLITFNSAHDSAVKYVRELEAVYKRYICTNT